MATKPVDTKLIPVIEVNNWTQNIEAPDNGPFWLYPKEWELYNHQCHIAAGYPDPLIPYSPGSSFYRTADITNRNLSKLIANHTVDLRAGVYDREMVSPLFGGYVLNINGEDKFFPQCCGDLSDISYYENFITKKSSTINAGHPQPRVRFQGDQIVFDFRVQEFEEAFTPPPPDEELILAIKQLEIAISLAKSELMLFAERVRNVNILLGLNIADIDALLIWGDN